ncbi:hypothetical protein KL929_000283 [Ogataea haglerorum]|uniref:uncharacterized protein n=1 Tax=Ogataea haglerorum TaxID=1937702 RepID=UPI001C89EE09|nr:uncharacterized protein KL911_000848 [Ogataea haglerorum]KAG7750440.1 hypothetical protein KL912_001000 [Ogataea haglerorum]KAG7757872.1 hypothetical protein KL911_000848 [Ogataea haglerorum]KAG7771357.1 hypothetical protein KL931_001055 [Ogataea haglerorum]KAG7789289.1 hypothetical protein KL945_001837 [Ogataea haglerorum]KAG7790879.1 hypothetical protein KL910_002163 [Ogataea haglerorum]
MESLDRKRSPPFLELSQLTVQALQRSQSQAQLDFGNVLTLWTTLIKSSDVIKNGKRLENISWRVVNRNILLKNDFNKSDFSALIQISSGKVEHPITKGRKHSKQALSSETSRTKSPVSVETDQGTKEITTNVSDSEQNSDDERHLDESKKLTQKNLHHQQSLIHKTPHKTRQSRGHMFFIENTPSPEAEGGSSKSPPSPKVRSLFNQPVNDGKPPLESPQKTKPQHIERDRSLERLNQQHALYGTSKTNTAVHSPQSETQRSQVSLFDNKPGKQAVTKQHIMFSSDDEISDGSDWSSMSGDSDLDDDDEGEEQLNFSKTNIQKPTEKPQMKRSLLSGLFLDKMGNEVSEKSHENGRPKSKSPGLVVSPSLGAVDRPEMSRASTSAFNVNALADVVMSPTETTKSFAQRKITSSPVPSTDHQRPPVTRNNSSNNPHLVSKSAISLASFLANNRRPHATANEIHNGHYDRHHESNAPPTAATLLPTALSTHMFLPTMNLHRQSRARDTKPSTHSPLVPKTTAKTHPNDKNSHASRGGSVGKDNDKDSEEVVSISSSVKSIEIPGSLAPSRTHSHRGSPVHHPSRPGLENRGSFYFTKVSTAITTREMLTKELPSNLVESINNENKLIHASSTNLSELSNHARLHNNIHTNQSSTATLMNGIVTADEESSSESEPSNNIIANGIMGNKLRLLTTDTPNAPFIDDDHLAYDQDRDDDWEDNLNYHARGW